MKLLNWLKKYMNKLNLRNKLLLSYVVVILLPVILYTLFSTRTLTAITQQQIEYSSLQTLAQTAELLAYRISNIEYVSKQIFFNDTVNSIIVRDTDLPISPALIGDFNSIQDIIVRQFKENDMDKINLYVNNNVFYSQYEQATQATPKTTFSSIEKIKNEDWYRELQNTPGGAMWLPPSHNAQSPASIEQVVSNVRLIRNNKDRTQIIAVRQIDILKSKLNAIVSRACATAHSRAILMSADGRMLASSEDSLNNGDPYAGIDLDEAFVYSVSVESTDWRLVSVVPFNEVRTAGNKLRTQILLVTLAICALAWSAAYLLSGSITKRIKSLTKRIKKIQNRDFSSIMTVSGNDEISELTRNYNYMLEQLRDFSEQQYLSGQELKNSELKALQAQINPHFLYNTLELINWTALENHVPQISEIVQTLAKYYKLSLNKGRDIVTVADEIAHIQTYIKLQNFRYHNAIELIIDVDEALLVYSIPKLIMQPIVENAVIHGILETDEKRGTISIHGFLSGSMITFSIRDNGVGMTAERCAEIFRDQDDKNSGYGVKNADTRIKLLYGTEYGISYEQPEERGCKAIIKIAAQIFSSTYQTSKLSIPTTSGNLQH